MNKCQWALGSQRKDGPCWREAIAEDQHKVRGPWDKKTNSVPMIDANRFLCGPHFEEIQHIRKIK